MFWYTLTHTHIYKSNARAACTESKNSQGTLSSWLTNEGFQEKETQNEQEQVKDETEMDYEVRVLQTKEKKT